MKKSALSRLIFPLDELLEDSEDYLCNRKVFTNENISNNSGQINHLIQKFMTIFENAPEEIFLDRYLGNNPNLNFKTIAQYRLSGNSWKSLAKQYSVNESRLRIFWYRCVKEMIPKLKEYLSEAKS